MLIDNLYNTWGDNSINDYWMNNKIIDCSAIDTISTRPYTESNTRPYIESYTRPYIESYTRPYNKSYNESYTRPYNKSYNKSYAECNTNTINSINIKKLNNNNYVTKSIQYYGNYSKDKSVKR